jgi:hypothetical protein
MSEELETEKWKIFFDSEEMLKESLYDGYIKLIFRIKNKERMGIGEHSLKELIDDLKDLGKWGKFRELKRDLEKNGD